MAEIAHAFLYHEMILQQNKMYKKYFLKVTDFVIEHRMEFAE